MSSGTVNSPPVNRTPLEIFRTIIKYVYAPDPPKDEEALLLYVPIPEPPLAASHVCRSWRNALLSDPTMWSTLLFPTFQSRGIMEFLRRSQHTSTPLKVSIKLFNLDHLTFITPIFLSAMFNEISRFVFLQVYIDIDGSYPFDASNSPVLQLLSCLQQRAPELQAFYFSYHVRAVPLEPTFLDTLFSGHAPNLKFMSHCVLDLRRITTNSPLRNLSRLCLLLPTKGVNHLNFLDLLESSPSLMMLFIRVYWADASSFQAQDSIRFSGRLKRRVHLPHLQSLVLKTHHLVHFLNFILRHVNIPPTVQWHIVSRPFNTTEDKEQAIHQFMSKAHFTRANVMVSVYADTLDLIFMETDTGIDIHDSDSYDGAGGNQLTYQYNSPSEFENIWNSVPGFIDSSKITHLQLTVSYSDWSEMKTVYGNLERIFYAKFTSAFGPLVPSTVICLDEKLGQRHVVVSASEGVLPFRCLLVD